MRNYLPFIFALGTALCWGLYGPTLGVARLADVDHSPFKPYVGIGIAYVIIAVIGGLVGMWYKGDNFVFTGGGTVWGVAAGTLGALGALSLTLCMFSGGARIPHVVMPVVFGGAVTIAALYPLLASGSEVQASPILWAGIVGMAICIVIVAMNTPHVAPAQTQSVNPAPVAIEESMGSKTDSSG